MNKKCTQCGITKELTEFCKSKHCAYGRHSWCKKCKNAKERSPERLITNRKRTKQLRKDNPDLVHSYSKKYYDKFPEKNNARWRLKYAIKKGEITRQPCIKCNNPKSHGHHPDYSKPLEVIWLCAKHHKELHRKD